MPDLRLHEISVSCEFNKTVSCIEMNVHATEQMQHFICLVLEWEEGREDI